MHRYLCLLVSISPCVLAIIHAAERVTAALKSQSYSLHTPLVLPDMLPRYLHSAYTTQPTMHLYTPCPARYAALLTVKQAADRFVDAEVQTLDLLKKSREVQSSVYAVADTQCQAATWDIADTYARLEEEVGVGWLVWRGKCGESGVGQRSARPLLGTMWIGMHVWRRWVWGGSMWGGEWIVGEAVKARCQAAA